jgi:hypothetical protein
VRATGMFEFWGLMFDLIAWLNCAVWFVGQPLQLPIWKRQAERPPYNCTKEICRQRRRQLQQKSGDHRPPLQKRRLAAVIANGFDGTTFHRFFAKGLFLWRFRLFINVGMAAVVVALEIRGRGFAAQIAIDALVVDVELSGNVLGVFICYVSHDLPFFVEWNVKRKQGKRNAICGEMRACATTRLTRGE